MKSSHSFRIWFYLCSLMHDSEVMCLKKVDTPWSIYRDFTVNQFCILICINFSFMTKGFLQKMPQERLGSADGLQEIKQHVFYRAIDWQALEQRLIQPPYKPQVNSDRDLANIDELFTKEDVVLTPDSPATLARLQQNEFEGFEYINPLILSEEFPV